MPVNQFRIATDEFGYLIFAASCDPAWSDRTEDAHTYDYRDNRELKLTYWKAYAKAVCGLNPEHVRIVEVQ